MTQNQTKERGQPMNGDDLMKEMILLLNELAEAKVQSEEVLEDLQRAKNIILAFLHADIQDPNAQEAIVMAREFLTSNRRGLEAGESL
jgi:hypothetical protein